MYNFSDCPRNPFSHPAMDFSIIKDKSNGTFKCDLKIEDFVYQIPDWIIENHKKSYVGNWFFTAKLVIIFYHVTLPKNLIFRPNYNFLNFPIKFEFLRQNWWLFVFFRQTCNFSSIWIFAPKVSRILKIFMSIWVSFWVPFI